MKTDDTRLLAEGFLTHRYWHGGEWTLALFQAWADEAEVPLYSRGAIEAEARRIDAAMDIDGSSHELAAAHMSYLMARLESAIRRDDHGEQSGIEQEAQEFIGRLTGAYPAKVVALVE